MHVIIEIILSLLILLILYILYTIFKYKKHVKSVRKRGIPFQAGLGRTLRFMTGFRSIIQMEDEIYKAAAEAKSPVVAISDFAGQSNFLIMDIEILKAIYVKDFENFVNRRLVGTKQSKGYLNKMLFFMRNDQWRGVRAKLSPTFTTSKLRRMFQIFLKSSERLDAYIKGKFFEYPRKKSVDIDFLQIFSKYALDVIATCAFGVDSKSFEVQPEERSTFEKMAKNFGFRFNPKNLLKFIVLMSSPKIADFFGIDAMDWESQNYFSNLVKSVMRRRRETGERQEDFLQLMMDAQQGLLKEDQESNEVMHGINEGDKLGQRWEPTTATEGQKKVTFDDESVIANGLVFLMAGFDPTQSVLLFTVYAMALEPEVQEKLYEEVKSVLGRSGGELTYNAMLEMTYLDMVINETLRLYASPTRAERLCNKNYHVPGTNLVIEKGSIILAPIYGFHHDPRFFPNPDKFIPQRFTQEVKATRHPYAFMPFGHGPRNCIGMRFALIKVKTALVHLIRSFRFAPCSKTKIPMEYDRSPSIMPKGDMWLNVTIREA